VNDERFVYTIDLADGTVFVVELPSLRVTTTISVFIEPGQAIVFTQDGSGAYGLNRDLSISRLELATNRIVCQVPSLSDLDAESFSATEQEFQ